MNPIELKQRIESLSPGTKAQVMDLTGTMDHYQVIVVSPSFEGKPMMAQHRLVMSTVQSEIDSGEVHALTMKTYTPNAYRQLTGEDLE
jgi:stress-induced morphogen